MTTSLLHDAFRHHAWATNVILDACANLTDKQLALPSSGTYGPIIDTLRHLVGADLWYLRVITDGKVAELANEETASVAELKAAARTAAAAWEELLAGGLDADRDIARSGDGWEFHAPLGLRLAQAIHHGTDHRSQICTALTALGIQPPLIDLWDWGAATGRTRETALSPAE